MDDLELETVVAAEIADAVSYIDNDVGPDRAKAVDYYFGRPFGDEEQGRSTVVSRDVHDTIQAIMPSLMRIFFGPERVVEFVPTSEAEIQVVEDATDYINLIITRDNDGFNILMDVIKNALREKVGFVKYWWDTSEEVEEATFEGVTDEGLAYLSEQAEARAAEQGGKVEIARSGESVTLKLITQTGRVVIEALPPEEFLISRRAGRDLQMAGLVAHRTMKTVSELIELGLDREAVEAAAQDGDELRGSEERLARNPYWDENSQTGADLSQKLVLYIEAYIRVDYDGDGVSELRRVCMIGDKLATVKGKPVNEVVEYRPFADFQCDPEPHTFFGQSVADKTMDIQRNKSVLLRNGFDGLALAIHPRVRVGKGGNIADAMNPEVGAIMRGEIGDYEPFVVPDVSKNVYPALTYMDEVRENRTGMSKVSMGLDAEALQNTTATAAQGQFTRSQDRIDLYARIMASGMRDLFRGVLRLVVENQKQPRWMYVAKTGRTFDPRSWRADMDVICNVGLGGGSDQQKGQLLSLIAGKQEAILQMLGPSNPLVTPKQYYTTLAKLVETGGFKNPDAFFTDPDSPEAKQRAAEAAQQPPKPDPKMVEAQERLKLEQAKAQGQMALEQQKAQLDAEARRQQAMGDAELARYKADLDAQVTREKNQSDLIFRQEVAREELGLKERIALAELGLKERLGVLNAQAGQQQEASTDIGDVEVGGDAG